jgi:hypothetical protein
MKLQPHPKKERTRVKRLAVLMAAGLAASATALVLAVGGSAQGPTAKTFQLEESPPFQFTEVHSPPKRVPQGDAAVYRAKLTDASGQTVGSEHSHCVFTKAGSHPVALCTDSIFLRDGRITAVGGVNMDRDQLLPVVGGTGAYEGAEGTLLIAPRRRKTVLSVNLRP